MIYYTPEMFEKESLEERLEGLFTQKETLEFQLGQYNEKFDTFKKINYEAMFIYERKKVHDKGLIPNKKVLQQVKAIETDEAVKEFRQTITTLSRDLKNVQNTIDNEAKKIENMFSFKEFNLKRYYNDFKLYMDGGLPFEHLMEDIFNTEFNNKKMYYDIAALRNYAILYMLIEKAPTEAQRLMRLIYDEAKYVYIKEEVNIIDVFGLEDDGNQADVYTVAVLTRAKYANKIGGE